MSMKQCSDGISDMTKGYENASKYKDEQSKAIDCLMNPKCRSSDAQSHADASAQAYRDTTKNAADAIKNLGASVPGTTMSGPVPQSVADQAANIIPNLAGPK